PSSSSIPYLKPQFLVGNMIQTGIFNSDQATFQMWSQLKSKYGDLYYYWFGPCRC
ncbi:unnamed protein product, partial [Didymodactylos carnosus]